MPAPKPAWHESRHLRRTAIVVLAIIVAVEAYLAVFVRDHDFIYHYRMGQHFLAGDPYLDRLNWQPVYLAINDQVPLFVHRAAGDWYPLARVMMNAALAVLPVYAARAACYLLAVASIAATYRMWREMAEERWPAARSLSFAAAVLAVLLLIPLVLRDLDECGLQFLLLFFLTSGGYALWRGRSAKAGFWLAAAASFKATPLICLPFLVWKRQWKAAVWMAAFAVLWAIAPAIFLGWQGMLDAHQRWLHRARDVSAERTAYPHLQQFEAPKPQNVGLQALLARYLEHYPPGHSLHLEHPAFRQFLDLDPQTAYRTVKGLMLAIAAGLAWRCRRRFGPLDTQADFAPEWAAVCVFCALVAPLCWKQHLVVALPAMFLTLRAALIAQPDCAVRWVLLGLIAAVVLLARHGIGGREFSIVMMSYKFDTMAILLLVVLALTIAPRGPASEEQTSGAARKCFAVLRKKRSSSPLAA